MSKLNDKFVRQCLVGFMLALLACAPIDAQPSRQKRQDCVSFAQAFLTTVYPELRGRPLLMELGGHGRLDYPWSIESEFGVTVTQPIEWPTITSGGKLISEAKPPRKLFVAGFWRGGSWRLMKFTLYGEEIANESKNKSLRELVEDHPEWSDEQVIQKLKEAGARYGPSDKEDLRKVIPVRALEKFLGPMKVAKVEFSVRHEQEPKPLANLYWRVRLDPTPSSKQRKSFFLILEPFEGRLVQLFEDLH